MQQQRSGSRHHGSRGGMGYIGAPLLIEEVVYETDVTPNALYKKYRKWYFETKGSFDGVLSFKKWLEWAKAKGLVEGEFVNADSSANSNAETTKNENEIAIQNKKDEIQNMGSRIGKSIAVLAVIVAAFAIIANLTSTAKTQL